MKIKPLILGTALLLCGCASGIVRYPVASLPDLATAQHRQALKFIGGICGGGSIYVLSQGDLGGTEEIRFRCAP